MQVLKGVNHLDWKVFEDIAAMTWLEISYPTTADIISVAHFRLNVWLKTTITDDDVVFPGLSLVHNRMIDFFLVWFYKLQKCTHFTILLLSEHK